MFLANHDEEILVSYIINITEVFCANRAYIAFWADFHFFAGSSLLLADGLVLT